MGKIMKLFIVSRERWWYDEYNSFVVRAGDEKEAILLACKEESNSEESEWKCEQIEPIGESNIIHSSFNAG